MIECTLGRRGLAGLVLSLAVLPGAFCQDDTGAMSVTLESSLDVFMEARMRDWFIPAAVCVVVLDGKPIFTKGYGVSNLKGGGPIDPETSLFYLASTGKLFTAISVLQLAEQGKLDLHTDVNEYLKTIHIKPTFTKPVTLHDLLTHSAGFDERNIGYVAAAPDRVLDLDTYLTRRMPPRVRPAGETLSYSNHGFGLAGHIAASRLEMTYYDSIQQNILGPCGMTNSIAALLPPEPMAARLVTGYWSSGAPVELALRQVGPAGGVFSTGTDMGKLMMALLPTEAEQSPISTFVRSNLFTRQLEPDPAMPGWGYAVWEATVAGRHGWQIGGSAPGWASGVFMVPDRRLGIYVAIDRQEPDLTVDLFEIVLPILLPETPSSLDPPRDDRTAVPCRDLAGWYRTTRTSLRSMEKVVQLFDHLRVDATSEDKLTITLPSRMGPTVTQWNRVAGVTFRNAENGELLAFNLDDSGRPRYLFLSSFLNMPMAFERIPRYETPSLVLPLVGIIAAIFAVSALCLVGAACVRVYRRRNWRAIVPRLPSLHVLVLLLSTGGIAFLIGLVLQLADLDRLLAGPSIPLYAVLTLPMALIAVFVAFVVACVRTWRAEVLGLFSKICLLVYSLVCLTFLALLWTYNLIGFKV